MEEKIPCSVLVLTLNAEKTIPQCLSNLSPFGEILVHDGNSTDRTVEIAKSFGARVLRQVETEEPNVRVTDFTAIRLKQRAGAQHDWVFYLDADEHMSDELVREIGEILNTAHEKTIVKVPRLPVLEGRVIRHGAFWPEIVPRLHHRKGGCTLRAGKTVHEKYVYDRSFTEIVTRHPLYVPLEPLDELLSKDRHYIRLEIGRLEKQGGYPWSHYLRWFLFREPFVIGRILLRILWCRLRYRWRDCLPLRYEWRVVRYHLRLWLSFTAFMFLPRRSCGEDGFSPGETGRFSRND